MLVKTDLRYTRMVEVLGYNKMVQLCLWGSMAMDIMSM